MNDQLKSVSAHMLHLGLGALTHANWHSNYMPYMNDSMHELSVLQAAHAAEILIKAKIAEEHPLLIFEQLPRLTKADRSEMELRHLFEKGRTVQYSDLPDRLWATTGMRLTNIEIFNEFGKLRNTIQHFAPPRDISCSQKTVEFIYSVIDPFINECWGLCAIDYNEDHEPYKYLVEGLIGNGIYFFVSAGMIKNLDYIEFDWPEDEEYQKEMVSRIEAAKKELEDEDQ